ncbi:MAG TPA: PQQ-dependent dehydrogenase, methanol/ethanol family [Gammaproteobacteria bacterium]|nr:PQQ-dependent dehydrogenase, methanol/ethanol family [Gammaproteobacteria bacterium]
MKRRDVVLSASSLTTIRWFAGAALAALLPDLATAQSTARAVDDAALIGAPRAADEWLTIGRDYAETRFSPLRSIDSTNVARLGLAWDYDTGSLRGLEATPLVSNGVLYASTPWSNVFALDARTGRELWRWDAQADRVRGARACCDVVNRGVALYDGKVYVGVVDGRLVALDAATGKPVWDVQTTPVDEPYTITGAPRVVDGKVVIGNGGAELGVRGFVSAYDPKTGRLVWRFYIVPGDPSKPFESKALEAAAKTWTGEWWKYGGGGTAWDSFAYDADAKLLYVGTGNGSPWDQSIRSPGGGDNLYLSSILALDAATGELKWHYQTTPGENWDYTAVQQLTLTTLTIGGRERKVVMQAPKNGFFYVLDRLTGELLSAQPYAQVTWATGVDLTTGRPIETKQARYGNARTTLQPGPGGAHNWQPMSFNPATGLVYLPAVESNFVYVRDPQFLYRPRAWNLGVDLAAAFGIPNGTPARAEADYSPGGGQPAGAPSSLLAWDPVAAKPRWRVPYPSATGGGTLTTAGNLVFQGVSDGRLVAYSADKGEKLWEAQLGNGVMAAPSTYSLDGKQYVSVLVGWGGASGLYAGNPTGQYKATGRLFTFVLDGRAPLAPIRGIAKPTLTAVPFETTEAELAQGALVFGRRCAMCHGINATSAGAIADLRYASPQTYEAFDTIVRQGAYQGLGMPRFDFLTEADVRAVKAFVLTQRAALQK